MGKISYLVRLDDACPTMDSSKWELIERILNQYSIRPMVGIIPKNKDPKMFCEKEDNNFWAKMRLWQQKKWTIALHGFDHVYITKEGGLHPLNFKSEFAGVPIELQKEKLRKGYEIMISNGIYPDWFFAPSHTFDLNTIKALKEVTPIRKISDTFSFNAYKAYDLIFFPQQLGYFRNVKLPGVWTFCFHPNTMKEKDFENFERFISNNRSKFSSFDSDTIDVKKKKTFVDKLGSQLFFLLRRLKNNTL